MEIPNEIMKKICLYRVFSPHPVAILFKQTFTSTLDDMNEVIPGDYKYGMDDSCIADDMSFAHYHFHQESCIIPDDSLQVYYYAHMAYDYVSTLNEYARNRVGDYNPFLN